MGRIERRLEALEEQIKVSEGELRNRAYREFLRRLTFEESEWLGKPIEEAEMLVDCPIHGGRCDCRNEQRRQRSHEEYPELHEEYLRRRASLLERAEEIMARDPCQQTEADRQRRREQSIERQKESAERNRQYAQRT